jgi:hypothetical protein
MSEAGFAIPKGEQRWGVLSFWASEAHYAPKFDWQFLHEQPRFA